MNAQIKVDPETGEILPIEISISADKAPAIAIDITKVADYHDNPKGLAHIIRQQAGLMVFDIGSKKGREACKSHAVNIIRCIAPAAKESQRLAEAAKLVVKQDLYFRKVFEDEVREIAAFHRRFLTEYEEAVAAQAESERLAEEARIAKENYLSDWQEALDYDELFTLRREKAEKARLEIELDIATKNDYVINNADGHQFLFADMPALLEKPLDEFQAIICSRIEQYQVVEAARLEAEQEKIRQEQSAKIKLEAERECAQEEIEPQLDLEKDEVSKIISMSDAEFNSLIAEAKGIEVEYQEPVMPNKVECNFEPEFQSDFEPEPKLYGYTARDVIAIVMSSDFDFVEDTAKRLIIFAAEQLRDK